MTPADAAYIEAAVLRMLKDVRETREKIRKARLPDGGEQEKRKEKDGNQKRSD